jgi:hypothetical protein
MGADAADLRRERAGRRRRQHYGSGCGPASRGRRRRELPAHRAGRCLPDGTDRIRRVPHWKVGTEHGISEMDAPEAEHRHVQLYGEAAVRPVTVPRRISKIKVCLHAYPNTDFPICFTPNLHICKSRPVQSEQPNSVHWHVSTDILLTCTDSWFEVRTGNVL